MEKLATSVLLFSLLSRNILFEYVLFLVVDNRAAPSGRFPTRLQYSNSCLLRQRADGGLFACRRAKSKIRELDESLDKQEKKELDVIPCGAHTEWRVNP